MTEKTARLGTTDLHIQHDHDTEPGVLHVQLDNEHGVECWTQTVERVARAMKQDSARADFDFRGEDQHVRLVIGTDGGFAEVEDPDGDLTEHEFTAYELSRALYEVGARDPLPHEVLVPALARVARALASEGRRLLVGPLSQSTSWPSADTLLVERDGLAAEVMVVKQPMHQCYQVAMPIHPSHQHGSRVLLEDHDVLFGDDEREKLVETVERALVKRAYGVHTREVHMNNGLHQHLVRHHDLVPLAGSKPTGGKPGAGADGTTRATRELWLADGSGHEFRARLLTEVEPMEDGQNDGHLMLSFHNEGEWQGACALHPDQVRELAAMCARALDQLSPKGAMTGSSGPEREDDHRG